MGTNKRYAEQIDQRYSQRTVEIVMRDAVPEGLKTSELELEKYALTIPPTPVPVTAWVRYGGVPIHIEVEAVKWTDRVVACQWDTPQGQHKAWLWASAVERR